MGGTVHGPQLVPKIRISTVFVSKLLPLMFRLNCWLTTGGLGFVLRLLREGVAPPIVRDSPRSNSTRWTLADRRVNRYSC